MRDVQIINETLPFKVQLLAGYCRSFLCRLRGLMFRRNIPEDWGLVLVQSSDSIVNSAIHMVGVPFDLGVVWINSEMIVVDRAIVKQWVGLKSPSRPAMYVLEMQPKHLEKFQIGDKLRFDDI
jgi:uncharacterized membrane protein (UPF0127 family)